MNQVIWMPHPAHFIGAARCQFRLATAVKVGRRWAVVSTVGEYRNESGDLPNELIGAEREFETYVWHGTRSDEPDRACCPIEAEVTRQSMAFFPARNAADAARNHRNTVASLSRAKTLRGWQP